MVNALVNVEQFLEDDGTVNHGRLIRFYRKEVMQWKNAQILTDLYNEFMDDGEKVTVRWIQRVEKENKVPIDEKRRWILSTLLTIPATQLGLETHKPFVLPEQIGKFIALPARNIECIDIKEYDTRLRNLWISWPKQYAESPGRFIRNFLLRLRTLEDVCLYGERQQKEQAAFLLCNYLLLFGNIRRDQGYPTAALPYLTRAIALAQEKAYAELLAKAFYVRGYCRFDIWGICQQREDQTELLYAIQDFGRAQEVVQTAQKQAISQPLKAAIFAESGLAQAYMAKDMTERLSALHTIDTAEKLVNASDFQRDRYFLHVNTEWYHIDKAEAYVALKWPQSAIDEIALFDRGDAHTRYRYIYTDIIEAEAYIAKGQVEMGIACAEMALPGIQERLSFTFLARLLNMYGDLKQHEKHFRNPDVARLGVKLLQIQQPEIFHERE